VTKKSLFAENFFNRLFEDSAGLAPEVVKSFWGGGSSSDLRHLVSCYRSMMAPDQ